MNIILPLSMNLPDDVLIPDKRHFIGENHQRSIKFDTKKTINVILQLFTMDLLSYQIWMTLWATCQQLVCLNFGLSLPKKYRDSTTIAPAEIWYKVLQSWSWSCRHVETVEWAQRESSFHHDRRELFWKLLENSLIMMFGFCDIPGHLAESHPSSPQLHLDRVSL